MWTTGAEQVEQAVAECVGLLGAVAEDPEHLTYELREPGDG
ncbi:hypothetical protein ACIBQ5_12480 [Streptomyces massasporeus]